MGEKSPKLLDFMVKKEQNEENKQGSFTCSDDKKLELRLGLPCEEDWSDKNNVISSYLKYNNGIGVGGGGSIVCGQEQKNHPWASSTTCLAYKQQQQQTNNGSGNSTPTYFQHHKYQTGLNNGKELPVLAKDGSQACTRIGDLQQPEETKAVTSPSANPAVPNSSQKRAAPAPVVGWPPIRSFRKNLASSSLAKAGAEPQNGTPNKPTNEKATTESTMRGHFVKINMDGVPIGRKVDLNAYDCYENLSSAVDELFRGLLAAQNNFSIGGVDKKQEEQKPITGLLDGTGEYTLVYEDNEGDRMLVGDVPWQMFVSTVKRLRVLKSSDLSTLSRGGSKQGKVVVDSASR